MRLVRVGRFALLLVAAAAVLPGCMPKAAEEMARPSTVADAPVDAPAAAPSSPAMGPTNEASPRGAAEAPRTIPRKIIYEGHVTLEAEQVGVVLGQVTALARRVGGYEGNMEQTAGDRQRASVTLRVPAEKFGAVMDELTKLGRALSRRVEAKDVGEEWVDLEARIKTKQREEQRLLALLEKAGSVTALLEVERELSRVRGEVEQAQGRLRFLGSQVALSTINVEIVSVANVVSMPGWSAAAVAREAGQTFMGLARALATFLIRLVILAPFWLLLLLPWWLVWRWYRRREPSL